MAKLNSGCSNSRMPTDQKKGCWDGVYRKKKTTKVFLKGTNQYSYV